jgi:hypothetical protein
VARSTIASRNRHGDPISEKLEPVRSSEEEMRSQLARLRGVELGRATIDRLTPLALASASSDQPRSVRSFFTRTPRWRLMASAEPAALGFLGFADELMACSILE